MLRVNLLAERAFEGALCTVSLVHEKP